MCGIHPPACALEYSVHVPILRHLTFIKEAAASLVVHVTARSYLCIGFTLFGLPPLIKKSSLKKNQIK